MFLKLQALNQPVDENLTYGVHFQYQDMVKRLKSVQKCQKSPSVVQYLKKNQNFQLSTKREFSVKTMKEQVQKSGNLTQRDYTCKQSSSRKPQQSSSKSKILKEQGFKFEKSNLANDQEYQEKISLFRKQLQENKDNISKLYSRQKIQQTKAKPTFPNALDIQITQQAVFEDQRPQTARQLISQAKSGEEVTQKTQKIIKRATSVERSRSRNKKTTFQSPTVDSKKINLAKSLSQKAKNINGGKLLNFSDIRKTYLMIKQ